MEINVEKTYKMLEDNHEKYLKEHDVKLPRLLINKEYTKNALVLCYLANYYGTDVSKKDITAFVRQFYPTATDIQQGRHLATQSGWNILSGTRGNKNVKTGHYKLVCLKTPYQDYSPKGYNLVDWNDNRCFTCGSIAGEESLHYKGCFVKIEMGHMDPSKDELIPQCQFCNRAYKNNWEFDDKGRVKALHNPEKIKASKESVQKAIYEILKEKFGD